MSAEAKPSPEEPGSPFRYFAKNTSVEEVAKDIRRAWDDLLKDPNFCEKAKNRGIDLKDMDRKLKDADKDLAAVIVPSGIRAGIAGAEIVILFTPAIKGIVTSSLVFVWNEFVLGEIRRRRGKDSLKEVVTKSNRKKNEDGRSPSKTSDSSGG